MITPTILRWFCALLVLTAAGTLAACNKKGSNAGADIPSAAGGSLSGRVSVDGSATVFPLSQAMAEAFRESNPAVQFAIEFSGTGGGFKKFCAGQLDIADASRLSTPPRANNARPSTSITSRCPSRSTASR